MIKHQTAPPNFQVQLLDQQQLPASHIPQPNIMANFRRFRPDDLNKLSKCNLDPLTETYELGFYLQYYAKWPSLFQVAEDQDGNIIGYSEEDPKVS